MTSKYIRWGGLAAILGGALLLIADGWGLVQEVFSLGPERFSEQAATNTWTVMSVLFMAGGVLILLGLVGIYARQAEEAGILGLVGFLAAFVSMALVVGAFWTFTFVAPSAATEAPAFLDGEPAGPLGIGFMLTFMSFPAGLALFGIATFRARVFPRIAAVALTLGALVAFAPFSGVTILLDVALIWVGYSLYSERRAEAASPELTPPVQPAV
ncbi:MAG: hypothetical protein H0V53_06700 [Rubrobacter sp.]|nr:hypothetical protein [Rubrobacter sp.]